ncbi:cell division protein FtsQ/DivIB [Candidatus Endomicrobiellum agilis]|uniref:cell division protein FtsQ/DivIB n=1 Tax=Candidatus Endomicrobiellum agilis TaxID=3238957 RepID=UPI0035865D85|nr:FtsQ-type POTRA domain-containing protein [Endomicrobium sp.]
MAKKKRYVYRHVSTVSGYSRSHKKGRKFIKLFFYLIVFISVAFVAYFGGKKLINLAYKSDRIVVKDIEVTGTKNVTKSEIKELLPFKIGDNLLKINPSKAEDEIKRLKPELKNIVINRYWQKVKIRLYERTPAAFVMCGNEMLGIDFDNTPFPLRGFMVTMKVPKLSYKSNAERKKLLDFIKRFKSACGGFFVDVSEMQLNKTGDIIFVMCNETVILWGAEEQEILSHKFRKFQKIYADAMSKYKRLEYVDMTLYRFGRAMVKPMAD